MIKIIFPYLLPSPISPFPSSIYLCQFSMIPQVRLQPTDAQLRMTSLALVEYILP